MLNITHKTIMVQMSIVSSENKLSLCVNKIISMVNVKREHCQHINLGKKNSDTTRYT